jgi:hypothetical protein
MRLIGIGVVICLFIGTTLLHAGLVAPRSLLELQQQADLIVVGSATATISVGSPKAVFPLEVSRVIKGDSTLTGTFITVAWTSSAGLLTTGIVSPGSNISFSGTGLWFLQQSANGWLLLPVMTGGMRLDDCYFPVPAGPIAPAYAYSPTASLSDRITSELAATLEANHPNSLPLDFLTYLLDALGSPVAGTLYQRQSASASVSQKLMGLSGLIRQGSASALAAAAALATQFASFPRETGVLLNSIQSEFRATDTNSLAILGNIAVDSTNPAINLREASAHALSAIHTNATLPYLAALLDDPDEKLRFEAIGGLGAFANGLSVQTPANTPSLASLQLNPGAPYRTADTIANFARGEQAISRNETAYLAFWKNWWATNRSGLGF